jgi:TPR repeat protein
MSTERCAADRISPRGLSYAIHETSPGVLSIQERTFSWTSGVVFAFWLFGAFAVAKNNDSTGVLLFLLSLFLFPDVVMAMVWPRWVVIDTHSRLITSKMHRRGRRAKKLPFERVRAIVIDNCDYSVIIEEEGASSPFHVSHLWFDKASEGTVHLLADAFGCDVIREVSGHRWIKLEAPYLKAFAQQIGTSHNGPYTWESRWRENGEDVMSVYLKAKQGNAEAQYNLGVRCLYGDGVPRDCKQALTWLLKATEQGNKEAQTHLAVMYREGLGVPQDYKKAHMWFNLAASDGDECAAERRDEIVVHLSLAEVAEAQEMAREWAEKHPKS